MATRRNEPEEREEIEVRVARTGGRVETVLLNGNRNVRAALDAAGIEYSESSRVKVNGETVDIDDTDLELEDGDRVTLSGKIKGGC